MFCPKCGKELREYERSCPYCGAAAAHGRGNRHRIKPMELIAIAAGVLALKKWLISLEICAGRSDREEYPLNIGSPNGIARILSSIAPLSRMVKYPTG